MVAAQLRFTSISGGLHRGHVLVQEDLLRHVEVDELHGVASDSTIVGHHQLKVRRFLHIVLVEVQQGHEVFTMQTNNEVLPGLVIKSNSMSLAVQDESNGLHNWPAHEHRCLARENVGLYEATAPRDSHRQHHSPSALAASITSKEELAVALEELEVLLGEATLLQHVDVAAEGSIAHEECTGTRVQHHAIPALLTKLVLERHHASFSITIKRSAFRRCGTLLCRARGRRSWLRAVVRGVSLLTTSQACCRQSGVCSPTWISLLGIPWRISDNILAFALAFAL